jgi:hypothetical protein
MPQTGPLMYGVPVDLDLRDLHGARLDQLCLGPFDLQLRFSSQHTISVEGSWRLVDATGVTVDESVGRVSDASGNQSRAGWYVRVLLSDLVEADHVDAPTSFSLTFASGHRLIVFDDSDQFESFSIQPDGIIV